MTLLKRKITQLIRNQGPIDVSHYMLSCLADPDHGYYMTAKPFGREGDFITAPEISQIFGELIGIWVIHAWQAMGQPHPCIIAEIGPGRGTLMADVLRTLNRLQPDLARNARIRLAETSPRLITEQRRALQTYDFDIDWLQNIDDLPHEPLIVVANELFDALPIHQYIHNNGLLYERVVSIDEQGELIFMTGLKTIPVPIGNTLPQGAIVEISPARESLMQLIARRIAASRGAALLIDYGALQPGFGDTLQAMSHHTYSDVFANPGGDDLTSHVDFATLQQIARNGGCRTGAMTQGEFLLAMGLIERAGRLGAGRDSAFQQKIQADVERLAHPDAMGELFKVLYVSDPKTIVPLFSSSDISL